MIIRHIFKEYDRDNNGWLDREEARNFMNEALEDIARIELADEAFEELFQEFDRNGDG